MVCKKCGKEIKEGSRFCQFCGEKCEDTPAGSQEAVKDTVTEASQEAAGTAAESVQEAAKEAAGAAQEAVKDAVSAATEAAKDAGAAQEAVKDAAAASQETAVEAARAAGDAKGAPAEGGKEKTPGSKGMKKLILIIGVAVAAVLLIVVCASALGSSPKQALKDYTIGNYTYNFKKYWNSSITAKAAQKALDLYDEDDYEDDYEDMKDYYEDCKDDLKDDEAEYKVSIKFRDVEKIKKSDREFEWAQELMEDWYDCETDKIQQFAIVKARVKVNYYEDGDKEDDYTNTTEYLIVKLGGKWYVTGFTNSDIKDYLKNNYK